MDSERTPKRFESIYSRKVRAGRRRTYFFDVRQTKGEDYYLTLTESTRKFNGDGYERHKIFLYKEDFNRFIQNLEEVIDHVKKDLMPDYDYDEYTKKHEQWDRERAEESAENGSDNEPADAPDPIDAPEAIEDTATSEQEPEQEPEEDTKNEVNEEDMSW